VSDATGFAIVAHDLGIKYDLRLRRRRTVKHTIAQLLRADGTGTLGRNEFWALAGVSFAVAEGDVLAVVGANGSGKSTLLKALAGVLRPDAGAITTFGRSATLLTLGAGFEADLTGRENTYLNAAYLGFSRDEIDARMDDIVAFSELERFIEAPVSTYSSGMRSRLGFSIAAHLEPEILLLDEVLGVGDARFKRKSREKLDELMERARAMVVVSHSDSFVREVATKALWLDQGRLMAYGDLDDVLPQYAEASAARRGRSAAAA
jgi:ABC-type polysaccharide/polyol phosphate transport system ATPase subunit